MKLNRAGTALIGVVLLLLPHHGRAVGWVARHGLTGTQYQTEFEKWTATPYRLRPICVSGYEVAGQARYAAIWANISGPAWGAVHGWSEASFVQQVNSQRGQGWRPAYFNAFGVGSAAYFNAIFEPTSNTNYVFQPSLTWTEYTSQSTLLTGQGYQLVSICPFNIGTADYYAALWDKPSRITVSTTFRHRETGAQYQSTFESLTAQGWRLEAVQGFSISGEPRFSSKWTRLAAPDWWYSNHGLSTANYQAAIYNQQYQGYRPTFVSAFTAGGQVFFNTMALRNGGFGLDVIGQIDQAVSDYMQQYAIPGFTLAISRDGRLVFAKGYGYGDQAAGTLVHPLNRFRIASVSKPFCAAGVMTLEEAGSLDLTNRVFGSGTLLGTTYGNGSYSTRERNITVTHLLTHTTGWNDTTEGPIWDNANGQDTAKVLGQVLDNYEPATAPGTKYDYSNIGYCAAGRIIERLSGKTFEQYIRDTVMTPCGIKTMEIGNQTLAGRKANEVVYYDITGRDPYVDIDPHRMDANGGWIATAMDLLLFGRRLDGDSAKADIVSAASLNAMRAGSSANMTYGFGLFWDGARTYYAHNGCMTGSLGWLITREDGIHIAAMTNLRPASDSCGGTLGGVLLGIGNTLAAGGNWPAIDLFSSVNPAFDAWISANVDSQALTQLGLKELVWGPEADPDGDGKRNAVEAYFGQDPLLADSDPSQSTFLTPSALVHRWLEPTLSSGAEATPRWSPSLNSGAIWDSRGVSVAPNTRLIAPRGFQWMEATLPRSSGPRAFLRLDLSLP